MTQPDPTDLPTLSVGAALVQGLMVGSGIPPTSVSNPDPLDDATKVTLTKPVNATQLTDELSGALARNVLIAITDYNQNADISDSNPATLWISPSGLDQSVIDTVIANHSPYAAYDIPKSDQDYSNAVQKVMNDHSVVLSQKERDILLVGLVLRIESGSTTSVSPSFPSGAPTA